MSIKINLLPDVKLAKIKEHQRRKTAISIAVGSVIVSAGIMVAGFLVVQGQNLRINQLKTSINDKKTQETNYPNIKAMVSLQSRLQALPDLLSKRVYMTKLASVLSSVEPTDVDFTSLSLANGQLNIGAEGKSYLAAAKVAKAIEGANVTVGSGANASNTPYFTNVQLSAVSLNGATTTYSITANVNPGATSGQ